MTHSLTGSRLPAALGALLLLAIFWAGLHRSSTQPRLPLPKLQPRTASQILAKMRRPLAALPDTLPLGKLHATIYHAVPAECDRQALETADGSRINPRRVKSLRWCGVSRDLHHRWGGPVRFGDTVLVAGTGPLAGLWTVRDLMNARHHRRIDLLVPNQNRRDPDLGSLRVSLLSYRKKS